MLFVCHSDQPSGWPIAAEGRSQRLTFTKVRCFRNEVIVVAADLTNEPHKGQLHYSASDAQLSFLGR